MDLQKDTCLSDKDIIVQNYKRKEEITIDNKKQPKN